MSAKINSLVLVAVAMFQGSTERPAESDINGHMPVILNPLAGSMPNRRVLSGTVAINAGFIPGKTALVAITETEPDAEYGRRFNFTVANNNVSLLETLEASKALGAPQVIDIDAEAEVETTAKAKAVKAQPEVNTPG